MLGVGVYALRATVDPKPTNDTDTLVNDNGTAVEILFYKNRSINATDNADRAHNALAFPSSFGGQHSARVVDGGRCAAADAESLHGR